MSNRQFYILCLFLNALFEAIMNMNTVRVSKANNARSKAKEQLESYMDASFEGNSPNWYPDISPEEFKQWN